MNKNCTIIITTIVIIIIMMMMMECFIQWLKTLVSNTDAKIFVRINATSSLKVTVQFETEGNGQNEIFNHMDRSEVKL